MVHDEMERQTPDHERRERYEFDKGIKRVIAIRGKGTHEQKRER
jgi:hypothetical protein